MVNLSVITDLIFFHILTLFLQKKLFKERARTDKSFQVAHVLRIWCAHINLSQESRECLMNPRNVLRIHRTSYEFLECSINP